MAAFFIPGAGDHAHALEDQYARIRDAVAIDLGRRPTERRIAELWTRRGNVDCYTKVGRPDPIHGGTVIAIFDMGAHRPFVVFRQEEEPGHGVCEVLGCNAYSVLEFDF